MEIPVTPSSLINQLRSWFFAKDRSIYLAQNCLAYLSNGAYLSTAFIAETVLTASAATVAFSNIPQEFRHLILCGQTRSDRAAEADTIAMRFNNDAGANYDYNQLILNAAAVTGATFRAQARIIVGLSEATASRANNFAPVVAWISSYSVPTAEARVLSVDSVIGNLSADTDMLLVVRSGNWRNPDVVTRIDLLPNLGTNFVAGSRFQLYGVL